MTFRTLYTIAQAWCYKQQLKDFMKDTKLQIINVCDISPEYLVSLGVTVLILDYDGVLAAHGEPTPKEQVMVWLRQFSVVYAPHQIYILSNKPTIERKEFFQIHLPQITFITAKRKKPYPDGILQIISMSGANPEQLLLVDDRLGTGILATLIAGTKGLWLTRPYINIKTHPLIESGIIILRWLERTAIALF